ncbi:MAG: glycoside hydrolase family 3 C-terminal domain-containing protein, partial [Lachnospiraceae bacterium]|nr:glycoside hydrolase family 3 C-terminal domain-containing protein [Lachnospiraceae bacterium]
ARELLKGVKDGKITEEQIDERVDELLGLIFSTYEKSESASKLWESGSANMYAAHHAIARKVAAESIVLLKNDDNLLPLAKGTQVAVLGDFAQKPRFQGAGSSVVNARTVEDTFAALKRKGLQITAKSKAFLRNGADDAALLQEAVAAAQKAGVVLFYMGLDEVSESEGRDRDHMRIHENQIRALKAVAEVNPNVVVILSAGSPVEMPWLGDAKALLHGYLGGEAGTAAMAEAITGKVNPCGKLAETLPMAYEDVPGHQDYPAQDGNSCYKESLYVGYRYYDTAGVAVRFPFGYGLSYTTFAYSDIKIEKRGTSATEKQSSTINADDMTNASEACGGSRSTDQENPDGKKDVMSPAGMAVTFTLTNTGSRAGSEIAQLYISKPDSEIFRPVKELKGFAKVSLQPGESRRVSIPLDDKAFRYFNVKTGKWEVEGGTYVITVAASAAERKLRTGVEVKGSGAPNPYASVMLPACYRTGKVQTVSDRDFETLLGYSIPKPPKGMHRNSAIRDLKHGRAPLGWLVCGVLSSMEKKSIEMGMPDLNVEFIYNIPLRGIAKYVDMIDMAVVDGLVMETRGFWIIGLLQALAALIHNRIAGKALANTLLKQAQGAAGHSGKGTEKAKKLTAKG